MKIIEFVDFGIDNLKISEQSQPQPTKEEVLVKIEAVSLNYVDLLVIKGLLNPNLSLPYIPITDGAGIVEQVGENVTVFKPGDKVATTFIPDWDALIRILFKATRLLYYSLVKELVR